jgi:hypothetical protein
MSDAFSADAMMATVESIVAHGPRRPGSPGDLAVEADLAAHLESFGFESVRLEPIKISVWSEEKSQLEVVGPRGEIALLPEVRAIPYVAFTPEVGVEGPLLFVESTRDLKGCRGAIVVAEIGFPPLKTKLLLGIAIDKHDPDDTLPLVDHPATWVRLGWHLYREAARRGAAGFVGILRDQPGGSCRMYAPYGYREANVLDKPLPGIWVGRREGAELRRIATEGSARARLVVRGSKVDGMTHNVVGELPGSGLDDEVVVLSCHHDSPYDSPVEDATGCAVVLALAERLARDRPLRRRLVVLFSAGHFYASIGTRTFIQEHRNDLVKRTALEVSIEHIALEAAEGPGGQLVPTGRPEATAMFVSFSRAIAGAVVDGARAHGLDRTILLPAEGPLGNYPPTDGGDWFHAGVPVINCISNPVYLLTDDDALRWVDRARLPRVAAAFDAILRRLDAGPRAELAATKSWPYRLAMKGLRALTTAVMTRLGTRRFY